MAFITGQILQGNCGPVVYTDGRYICSPTPDQPGVDPRAQDPINFYAKITGKPGETVNLDIRWPAYDESLIAFHKYRESTFFALAHNCVYTSTDEQNWQRMEQVESDAESLTLRLHLTLTEPQCYVSVNYYYTCRMYQALRQELSASPFVQIQTIGPARDGQDMFVFKVTDPDFPVESKQLIYLQGGLHCCEYGGMHLMDGVLRYLTGGSPEARALLKKYEFHVTPVASIADWADGYKDELFGDNNVGWDTLQDPEPRAIDAYLRSLPKKPVFLLDVHNCRTENFLFLNEQESPEFIELQERFASLVAEYCDFMPKGSIHRTRKVKYATFRLYACRNFGYGFCAEVSRFALYNRALGKEEPLSRESFLRFGSQLPHAIDAFLSTL